MGNFFNRKLVLLALTILIIFTASKVRTSSMTETAEVAVVRFIPSTPTVEPGSEFTVACIVENVSDLTGVNIHIHWNTTMLTYMHHTATVTVEDFPATIPPSPYAGILHNPKISLMDQVPWEGSYWFTFATLGGPAFNGSGTAFAITFQALSPGVTAIELLSVDLARSASAGGDPIPHSREDCTVTISYPPQIHSVCRNPNLPNYDEDVTVTANVTDPELHKAMLQYTCGVEWQNVSMNDSYGLYQATIPGQPYNTTVEYRVYANNTIGAWSQSDTYSYITSLIGDVDGDGDVDMFDVVRVIDNYGKSIP